MNVREWRLQFGTVGDNDVFVPVEGLFADAGVFCLLFVYCLGQYRIILSADTASEVRQMLSQKRR